MTPATFRILVVDDDPDLRQLVGELLRIQGYEVLEAASGGEGIEVARGGRPHLILMDFYMPELGGAEAVAALRKDPTTRTIPIVALTGATSVTANELVRAGCVGYIAKPIDVARFAKLIAEFLSATAPRLA